MHNCLEVDSNLFKVSGQLRQVPLASTLFCIVVFLPIFLSFATIGSCVFNIVFILFVD
jgi:hypothetical protein